MIAFVVTVDPADVELAADALWGWGVVAVEERAAADGRIELWTSLGDDESLIADTVKDLPSGWAWRLEQLDERVADTWRDFAAAVWVEDDLVVVPAWVDTSVPSVSVHGEPVTVISIEPGSTFGMGDHPTTQLSMRALRRALSQRPDSTSTALDVGCGSGVLAVAAVIFGATHATGVDIAPASVATTQANAERNGVADRVTVSTTPLDEVEGVYDVVVANILAPTLVQLSTDLRRVVADGGTLIISGVLHTRHDHVDAALAPLRCISVDEMDGWVAITYSA